MKNLYIKDNFYYKNYNLIYKKTILKYKNIFLEKNKN